MRSCSKAPRGLFVLVRTDGIFTANALSPSPLLRQCPHDYSIRAGQNLPDKEFRSCMLTLRRRRERTISSSRLLWSLAISLWRVQDSNFSSVHSGRNSSDFLKTVCSKMLAISHHSNNSSERFKIVLFRRHQWS